jgi:peptide/nickel transport system substrate-binding protein
MKSRLLSLLACVVLVAGACGSQTPSQSVGPPATNAVPGTTAGATSAPLPSSYPSEVKYVVTIRLKPNIKWSDGSDFTAADWVGTYDIFWAQQDFEWESLVDVVEVDDLTFQFWLSDISQRMLYELVRWNQAAARSQYGEFFDRARELRLAGTAPDSAEVTQLLADLTAFRPDNLATIGPFAFDPAAITEAQMDLVKNPGGLNADKIGFDKVIVYWGDTAQVVPLVVSNQLDYTTVALSPADERAVLADPNLKVIRGALGVGPSVWFNETIKPFDKKEFRQAVAYLLDRAQIGTVALGDSAKPIVQMAGFSDNLADRWLTPETQATLNHYDRNTAKAEELLTGLGWTKVGGTWQDETGTPVSYELTAPSDFVDFFASAEEVAQQLTAFGIKTTVRSVTALERRDIIKQVDYQMLIDFNQVSSPSQPGDSYIFTLTEGFFGSNSPDAPEGQPKGYQWPLTQTARDGSTVSIRELIAQSQAGLDFEAQKAAVQTLAWIFNDQLPIVPLYERYTNEPINVVDRAVGWLDFSDPIYQNNQGSDNYVSQQFLDGTLKVAPGGDGTFRTSAPYAQPPNYSFNYFDDATSLMDTITSPASEFLNPPLFWGSASEGTYINTGLGQSWELQEVN